MAFNSLAQARCTQHYAIDRLVKKLAPQGRLKLVYDAGPCGFWLHRYLTAK